jgi:hypothetical protein
VIVISSLIWAADPSAKRPSAVRASFGEPADLLRTRFVEHEVLPL